MLKMIRRIIFIVFKAVFFLFLLYVLFGFAMGIYSAGWMSPRADKAREEFEKRVTPGVRLEEIEKIANELHASELRIIKINEDGEEKVRVQFNRFPGGLSRNVCIVLMSGKAATSLECWYSG